MENINKQVNTVEMSNIVRFQSVFSDDFCKEISKEILNYRKKYPSIADSNPGCWMGKPHRNDLLSLNLQEEIVKKILYCANEYKKTFVMPDNLGTLNDKFFKKDELHFDAWFNINDPGSVNHIHSHPGNFLSGVIWFQSTGTGTLEFVPLNYMYKLTHIIWPYHGTSIYEPKDGDLLLFPSYLLHQVNQNTSEIQRISMAFDLKPAEISPYD